jgi:hypothetical protein
MGPFTQTADSLVIDTPQFTVTVPGVWQREVEGLADNVVYCGLSELGAVYKQFIVSGHLFVPGSSAEQRREAFAELLRVRHAAEEKATGGQATLVEVPFEDQDGLMTGGYVCLHPGGGRVAFSRTVCDREKAFNFYYELWGFTAPPDTVKLLREFEEILETAALKS